MEVEELKLVIVDQQEELKRVFKEERIIEREFLTN